MTRYFLFIAAVIFVPKLVFYVSSSQAQEIGKVRVCSNMEYPPPSKFMQDGCYIKTKLVDLPDGDINFWRLAEDLRVAQGTMDRTDINNPSAALVYEPRDKIPHILKSYCYDSCFLPGGADPLDTIQIKPLNDSEYIVWAPDDPYASRNGAAGYIEILNIDSWSLTKINRWRLHTVGGNKPLLGVGKIDQCEYLFFSAAAYYSPEDETIPGGYMVLDYPYFQSLDKNCKSIGINPDYAHDQFSVYDLDNQQILNPVDFTWSLKNKMETSIDWLIRW